MDRVSVKVEFKRALWICPKCGQEDITEMNPAGGNKYDHNCSKCDKWFNQFKELNEVLSYTTREYEQLSAETLDDHKAQRTTLWITAVKNPPKPAPITKEDLQNEKLSLEQQKMELEQRITKVTADIATAVSVKPVEEPIEEVKP